MTKRGLKSRPSSPSYGGDSSRNLEMVVMSSEDTRSSTRLRLQPLRKPKSSQKIKKKKKAAKFNGKMPKNLPLLSSFSCTEDFRKQYQEENPEVKSMREIGKTCGEKWKTMTYEEKVKYYDIATEKREEFHRAMTDYTKRVESGEYDESETESDFSE
ncbi:hypothetical protein Bca52824_028769 [Brassica carinata]|uniref:HMG box domain-containing protein n=1 Tax=Brassica carinata TaxID=52824 RepID=A0A8X7VD30_BRACI|nr:hypothetical protein Bca52824_028769 [Brassica carinata]